VELAKLDRFAKTNPFATAYQDAVDRAAASGPAAEMRLIAVTGLIAGEG